MDILDHLRTLRDLPMGSSFPGSLAGISTSDNWAIVVQEVCRQAVEEIEELRRIAKVPPKRLGDVLPEYEEALAAQDLLNAS